MKVEQGQSAFLTGGGRGIGMLHFSPTFYTSESPALDHPRLCTILKYFVSGLCRKSSGSGFGWQGSAGNRPGFANHTRRRDSTFGGGGARKDILQTKPLSFRNLHTM